MRKLITLLALLTACSVFAVDTIITISHDDSKTQIENQVGSDQRHVIMNELINYLRAIKAGARAADVDIQVGGGDAVAAFGTLTVAAALTAGDTVVIGGTTLTAVAEASTESGSLFRIGTTSTIAATNIASTCNANTTLAAMVTAASALGIVTVTADDKGVVGNQITSTETAAQAAWGAANFASGSNATANSYSFGR